jgi:hypothetical protein
VLIASVPESCLIGVTSLNRHLPYGLVTACSGLPNRQKEPQTRQRTVHGRRTIYDLFHAGAAEYVGTPADSSEADRIEWIPLAEIRGRIARDEIVSGPTLIGLLLAGASLGCRPRKGGRLRKGRPFLVTDRDICSGPERGLVLLSRYRRE